MRFVLPLLLVAGCATNFANSAESEVDALEIEADRPIGPAHGVEGELAEYEVKLRGILVGRVQVAVGKRGVIDGRPVVVVRSRAIAAGTAQLFTHFRWEVTTTVDIDSGCARDEIEEVDVQIPGKDRKQDRETRTFSLADCRRNVHAAAGALRGWFSKPGASTTLHVDFDYQKLDVELTDAAREMVGNTPAVRYDGTLRGKHKISAWISDEHDRVPLKLLSGSKLGEVEINLVSYEVPRDH